jgi:hypothetical protein
MANTKQKMVTAVFRDRVNAQTAYDRLRSRGYTANEVNVIMSDATRNTYFAGDANEGRIRAGSAASAGMATGGAIGTAVGATLAAVLAIGTTVLIPGLGWVAGPLAAAFAGGGAGAVAGGVIGGLVGLGIPEPNARAYEEVLREGGVVIGVAPHTSNDASAIQKEFDELKGENICYC